ncbi:protealysin inhibitor emfourin [Herbiconiux sp. P17]|uniref:protealysin inhibitor emfourin n=1 Tax=Herbiconiux wuyangfengii TaxID=3342794 RepID=UPI0035BAE965
MTPQDDDTAPHAAAARDAAAGPPAATGAGATDAAAPDAASGADAGQDTLGRELRITVARTGGVAGISPHWTVTASEEADVDSWLSLVESCPWDAPEPSDAAGTGRPIGGSADRFVYTIRVFLPTEEERDARVSEQRLGPWRDLIDRVKDAAR